MNRYGKAFFFSIVLGVILIAVGLLWRIPGEALTTRTSLNGESTENYVRGNTYSAIDEYVGGDAYNFIIGASLVAGEITGVLVSKTICVVGGALCICMGMTTLNKTQKEDQASAMW